MQQSRTEKLVSWSIALLTVALAWQFNFPDLLRSVALYMHIPGGSFLYHVIVDGGVAYIFVSIAWLAMRLYEEILWPWLPWLGCKRGWWIYALVAHREDGTYQHVEIVGYFNMIHTPTETCIKEGHAFYFENGLLRPRGHWHADLVWIAEEDIRFIFSMHSINPHTEALPAKYDGFLSLSASASHSHAGVSSWKGYFHDLGDRKGVDGEVYAERLSPYLVHKANKVDKLTTKYAEKFLKGV